MSVLLFHSDGGQSEDGISNSLSSFTLGEPGTIKFISSVVVIVLGCLCFPLIIIGEFIRACPHWQTFPDILHKAAFN